MSPAEEKTYQKLLDYAFSLLAHRRYASGELGKKLREKNEGLESAVDQVMKRLMELNYIDDEAFVEEWIRLRRNLRPRGIYMLRHELKQKGIGEEMLNRMVNDEHIDEYADAQKLLEKKAAFLNRQPPKKRRLKAFNLLSSKGFGIETIYKVLDSC